MEKTKLGISKELLAAGVFVAALAGGYVAVIICTLYVLLKEDDAWLKRMAVKAVATLMIFGVAIICVGLIPDLINWISSLMSVLEHSIEVYKITNAINLITSALSFIEKLFLLALAAKALKQQTVRVPVVDDFINKYI